MKRPLSCLLATLLLLSSLAVAEPLKFQFVVPTNKETDQPNRSGNQPVETRFDPFEKMRDRLTAYRENGLLPSFEDRTPALWIYLPTRQMLDDHKKALAESARRQFAEVYPDAKLKIKFRVVDTNIHLNYVYSKARDFFNSLKLEAAGDPSAEKYIDALEHTSEEAIKEEAKALDVSALTARRVKLGVALSRASIVLGTRAYQTLYQTWPAFFAGGAPAAAGVALVVADSVTEFCNAYYLQKLQRFYTKYPMPQALAERLAKKEWFQNRFLRWIPKSFGFFNNVTWNLGLGSVGRPALAQYLANLANPTIAAPSVETSLNVAEYSVFGAILYGYFTNGYNKLRDKGYISKAQIDMGLQVSMAIDTGIGLLSSNPELFKYRFILWTPQWGAFAVVGALGQFLPTKMDKFVAVESSIVNWNDIHEEQTTDKSILVEGEEQFAAVLDTLSKLDPCEGALRTSNEALNLDTSNLTTEPKPEGKGE